MLTKIKMIKFFFNLEKEKNSRNSDGMNKVCVGGWVPIQTCFSELKKRKTLKIKLQFGS